RTPHVAARVCRGDEYASAASPYPRSAGQKSASTMLGRPLAEPLHDLGHVPLEALHLHRDDEHPREEHHEDDEVGGRDVLLARRHARSSRSSRRWAVRRFPASSRLYSVANRESIAASETQNARNCVCVICGPCDVNTTGWMKLRER